MAEFNRYSGVVVKNKDKVLLCKRSPNKTLPNEWSIPSGKVEGNETPKDAAIREFYEETNIKLKGDLNIVDILNMYKRDGETKKGLMYIYQYNTNQEINPDLKKARDGFEHTKCGYFTKTNNPLNEKNKDFKKIIMNIFNTD